MKALPKLLTENAMLVPDVAAKHIGSLALNVQIPHQEQDNWCWCAIAVGVGKFFDSTFTLTQCETAAIVLGIGDACSRPKDPDVDTVFELGVTLSKFGHFVRMTGVLKFDDIREQIDAQRPIGVQVLFMNSGVTHFTVIRGYRTDPEPILVIDDPFYDESEWSYREFVDTYKGSGAWQQSCLTQ